MYEIRTINGEDVDLFRSRLARAFGADPEDDDQATERFEGRFEYDRTFAVLDGDDIIGTGGAFSFGLTVPGGNQVPMGGTAVITVQPTHRRKGVLRSLMDRHFEDVTSRGEALAGLWASEGAIYRRFGYGPATYRHSASIDTRLLRFSTEPPHGALRLVEVAEARQLLPPVYERYRPSRVGALTRNDGWWQHRVLADPESRRGGKTQRRYVVFEEDGSATGYATYRQKGTWDDFVPAGEIDVSEVFATTPAAHTGLWQFLTQIDLFPDLEFWNLALDDPLVMKVTDPRHIGRKLVDALWIRVMDVPTALQARRYEFDGAVTFEVADQTLPDNSGIYRLEVVSGVGSCEAVSAPAEISFEIDVLGQLYLGGGDALTLAAAGRIEGNPEKVWTLHQLFRTGQAPWCPEVF